MSSGSSIQLTGACACGAIRFRVDTDSLRPILECHCRTCRKTSGHVWAALAVRSDDLQLLAEHGLRWFDSSDFARRGFCSTCGSSLFYDRLDNDQISIAAGALDSPTGLTCEGAICVAEAGDYYTVDPDLTRQSDAFIRSEWQSGR